MKRTNTLKCAANETIVKVSNQRLRMSDIADAQREVIEKAWKVLNLQADTRLKLTQARTEIGKVAAGGALVAATAAITAALLHRGTP